MSEKLKSCPFCGDTQESFAGMVPEAFATGSEETFHVCCDCGAMGPGGKTMEQAVTVWNTRQQGQDGAKAASTNTGDVGAAKAVLIAAAERMEAGAAKGSPFDPLPALAAMHNALVRESAAVRPLLASHGAQAKRIASLEAWQPIETAPDNERVLVNFAGAGPIVAYRDPDRPEVWVRYLGFGKSECWPAIHEDYATLWMRIPPLPSAETYLAAHLTDNQGEA